jgi:hypothetical protein
MRASRRREVGCHRGKLLCSTEYTWLADFAQVVLGGAALGVGACFHDAGPGSGAKTSAHRNAVKATGRLRRAAADVDQASVMMVKRTEDRVVCPVSGGNRGRP